MSKRRPSWFSACVLQPSPQLLVRGSDDDGKLDHSVSDLLGERYGLVCYHDALEGRDEVRNLREFQIADLYEVFPEHENEKPERVHRFVMGIVEELPRAKVFVGADARPRTEVSFLDRGAVDCFEVSGESLEVGLVALDYDALARREFLERCRERDAGSWDYFFERYSTRVSFAQENVFYCQWNLPLSLLWPQKTFIVKN